MTLVFSESFKIAYEQVFCNFDIQSYKLHPFTLFVYNTITLDTSYFEISERFLNNNTRSEEATKKIKIRDEASA